MQECRAYFLRDRGRHFDALKRQKNALRQLIDAIGLGYATPF